MKVYIHLFKLTQEGIKNIKTGPDRVEKVINVVEEMGGKVIGIYSTMGEYDYVGVTEWPDDQAAAAFLLAWGTTGVVRTTTMKAFTMDEDKEVVAKLP